MTFFPLVQNRPLDLICMGRVAVDLYAEQIGVSLSEANSFHKYLGGCAGNIAVGGARLGLNTLMFSAIGQDEMGLFVKKTLEEEGVSTKLLYETNDHLTGLVLLGIKPPRDFPLMFYRNDCADMQLKPEQANETIFRSAKALLITGTGLSTPSMRDTTHFSVDLARKVGTAIIMDLDFRPVLWGLTTAGNGENRYIHSSQVTASYQEILAKCDLIVGTEEEICIAGGDNNVQQALSLIRSYTRAPIVVKLGERGCEVHFTDQSPLKTKPFSVEVLNVLGAGDGFMAGLLRGLLRNESWELATTFANASGALVVTRHGCSPAIPYWEELNYFIKQFDNDPLVWKSKFLAKLHQTKTPLNKYPLIKQAQGFSDGINPIVIMGKNSCTGMNFSSIKLRQGQKFPFTVHYEFAALLMTGRVRFHYENTQVEAFRTDYFSECPSVLHCPRDTAAYCEALTDAELLLMETENLSFFEPMVFTEANMLEIDHRGKGLLEDTSYRLVRTVFDKRNRPDSNLVVGEIITFQGRWSSYPSHYHSQPEIYHYRFSEPQGYAFGEDGPKVLRIEHYDTYQINNGQEHAHCTAPGYALYTLWFIRHEADNPYITPIFCDEHEWTRLPSSAKRVWRDKSICPR